MKLKKALLIVDMQNDFCTGGALAVPDGERIVPILNKYIEKFLKERLPIFASRDWHPKESKHFKKFGGLWPEHCIENTAGARFHPSLRLPKEAIVVSKGMGFDDDSYSAFQAKDDSGTGFGVLLGNLAIEELYIGGLATDYCVKSSVLDALKFAFKVKLLTDAIKGVNIKPGDSEDAINEMERYGAKKINFAMVSKLIS